jgi:transcriptional regulator with XRE-family HTH domain
MIFGAVLRKHREALDLREAEVARKLVWSASKVSRLEKGEHSFKPGDVGKLLSVYGVHDAAEQERMFGLARDANARQWWDSYRGVRKELQTHVSLEEIAQRLRSYENAQLLGLLQIPDYTRALVNSYDPHASPATIDSRTEFRALRASRFFNESTATLMCAIDEITLSRGYGNREIMRRQCEHLIDLAEHERVTFRIVPSSGFGFPTQIGTTTIFDFADDQLETIVYAERPNGALYLHDEQEVDEYVKGFDRLMVMSMSPKLSVQKLRDYVKKYS